MFRKLTALLLALLMIPAALAEVYEGTTTALSTVTITSEVTGTVDSVNVLPGDRVGTGDALATLGAESLFASADGYVSLINGNEGDDVDGTLLEVMPLERYQIHCTVEKAYQSADATLVHSGETLYVRCTTDGTHQAVGVVTLVEGSEYRVLTLGGELYVGETVYLYRDSDFTTEQRVGIGTVVVNDTQAYAASGELTRLCVQEGDVVERGQLLGEIGGGSVDAPASGIVTSVSVQPGDNLEEGQALAELVPDGQVCVSIQVDEAEAARAAPGQSAELTLPDGETTLSGTVLDCAWATESGSYTVRILPEAGVFLPLGMSVTARL